MGGTISTILKPRSRGDWLLSSHDADTKSFVDDHTCGGPSGVGATNRNSGKAITKIKEHLARIGKYDYLLNKPVKETV